MRIDLLRAVGLFLLAFFANGVFAHGLVQDPPARNWFCGAVTKPDHVANGVAQYPVCGNAFTAPGIPFEAGYSFMSVLTHTTGRAGVGPRTNVCGFNSETWNGAATVWDQPIDWPTNADDRGSAQFRVEHLLGSALLGQLGFPLLDHEARISCGRRAARSRSRTSRTHRSATWRTTTRRRTRTRTSFPTSPMRSSRRAARCRRAAAAT